MIERRMDFGWGKLGGTCPGASGAPGGYGYPVGVCPRAEGWREGEFGLPPARG